MENLTVVATKGDERSWKNQLLCFFFQKLQKNNESHVKTCHHFSFSPQQLENHQHMTHHFSPPLVSDSGSLAADYHTPLKLMRRGD